jgi:hypothetical protein
LAIRCEGLLGLLLIAFPTPGKLYDWRMRFLESRTKTEAKSPLDF